MGEPGVPPCWMSVVHRVYARALFEAAQEQGRLERVRDELDQVTRAAAQVPELRELLRNPQLDPRARASALEDVLKGGDELLRNFLLLLAERGRTSELEEIGREFERLVAKEEGIVHVELTTAVELSEEDEQKLLNQIEQASGRKVEATRSVEADLIGGIVLQIGSHRLDASVRGRLDRLRRVLAGGAAVASPSLTTKENQ
jgi:F-type H+-transporting ATPase subunit delta